MTGAYAPGRPRRAAATPLDGWECITTGRERIHVLEDETSIRELIRYNLERERYQFFGADSGKEALQLARRLRPDLVLLDLMLPDMDGLEVCRVLRADSATAGILIVLLTARTEDIDIVAGLATGADDYITKPFQPRVLLARLKAILRRREDSVAPPGTPIEIGDLKVDPIKHRVTVGGRPLHLTLTEFRILLHLLRQRGRVLSRGQILEAIQGNETVVIERTIDVHVASLRKKLGAHGARIETVRGIGYRFEED